jgi:hypothetical protein
MSFTLGSYQDYTNIQLLGFSKDITKWTDAINENPNPFLEISDIVENHTFGRVYEDYVDNLSSQLVFFENPSFGNNVQDEGCRPIDNDDYRFFMWKIDIS